MRLGPYELRRMTAAKLPQPTAERGSSGTMNSDGFVQPLEYNRDLTGQAALATWRRMRRSDETVREAEQHIFAPVKNATWKIQPATEDDPLDLEAAEFVRRALFEWPSKPWGTFLNQALTHLSYGVMVFEEVFQVVESELRFEDPDSETVEIPSRQFLTWRRFGQRPPWTIQKWMMVDGELDAIVQNAQTDQYGQIGEVTIPADTLLVFVNEEESDDWNGVSVLRSAYKAWTLKELIEKVAGVAAERHGVGTWVVYPPASAAGDEATLTRAEQILTGLRAGDQNYIVSPGPKALAAATGSEGWIWEVVTPPGQLPDFVEFLEYLRGGIKGNVLARFAELGHGQTGARSTGDTQSQVWYAALHSVATYICDVLNPKIARLVAANYEGLTRFPTLSVEDIESRNLAEFAEAHARLVVSGAVVPDAPYRGFIRRVTDAPEEADPEAADEIANPPVEEDTDPDQTPDEPPAEATPDETDGK